MTEERTIPIGGEREPQAIMAFLGAGLFQRPSQAEAVNALAAARRGIATCQARGEAISEWLAGEVHRRGICENAAVLVVLESLICVIMRRRDMSWIIPTAVRPSKTCWLSSAESLSAYAASRASRRGLR